MPCNKTCYNPTIIRERRTVLFLRKDLSSLVTVLSKNNFRLRYLKWSKRFRKSVNKFHLRFEVSNQFYKHLNLRIFLQIWIHLLLQIRLKNLIRNQKLKNKKWLILMRRKKRTLYRKELKLSFKRSVRKTKKKLDRLTALSKKLPPRKKLMILLFKKKVRHLRMKMPKWLHQKKLRKVKL